MLDWHLLLCFLLIKVKGPHYLKAKKCSFQFWLYFQNFHLAKFSLLTYYFPKMYLCLCCRRWNLGGLLLTLFLHSIFTNIAFEVWQSSYIFSYYYRDFGVLLDVSQQKLILIWKHDTLFGSHLYSYIVKWFCLPFFL